MKNILLICSLWLFGACALASPLKVEVPRTSTAPKEVRTTMPKNANTEFFGNVPSGFTGGKAIWLHFYSVQPKAKSDNKSYAFDFWEQISDKPAKWRKLSSMKVVGTGSNLPYATGRNSEQMEVSAMWLRDRTQQTPVIRVKGNWDNGVNADFYSSDSVFVFTQGWSQPPIFQQFKGHSDFYGSVLYSFDQTDERDILLVSRRKATFPPVEVSNDNELTTQLRWDGKAFVMDENASAAQSP